MWNLVKPDLFLCSLKNQKLFLHNRWPLSVGRFCFPRKEVRGWLMESSWIKPSQFNYCSFSLTMQPHREAGSTRQQQQQRCPPGPAETPLLEAAQKRWRPSSTCTYVLKHSLMAPLPNGCNKANQGGKLEKSGRKTRVHCVKKDSRMITLGAILRWTSS